MPKIMQESQKWTIKHLIEEIENEEVGIPIFQREFVWKPEQIKGFTEAIFRGYPIGTMMSVDVTKFTAPETLKSLEPASLVGAPWKRNSSNLSLLFVDGQQRATSLYYVFGRNDRFTFYIDLVAYRNKVALGDCLSYITESTEKNGNLIRKKLNKETEDRLNILKDLNNVDGHAELGCMPLSVICAPSGGYWKWMHGFAGAMSTRTGDATWDEDLSKFGNDIIDMADSYEIGTEVISSKVDLETLCEIFVGINTTGKKLTMTDIMVAKFFQNEGNSFRLEGAFKDSCFKYPAFERFNINIMQLLKVMALLKSSEANLTSASAKDESVISLTAEYAAKNWNRVAKSFNAVLNILDSSCSVHNSALLTYPPMLVPMVAAYCNENIEKEAIGSFQELLRIFYWCISFNSDYIQGSLSKQSSDYVMLCNWHRTKQLPDRIRELRVKLTVDFSLPITQGALYSSTIAALFRDSNGMETQDWMQGLPLSSFWGVKNSRNETDVHHIFPKKWLEQSHIGISPDVLANKTLITKWTNRSIQDHAPSKYIRDMIENIAKEHNVDLVAARDILMKRMEGHQVDSIAFDAMERDDYVAFLAARKKNLMRKVESLCS